MINIFKTKNARKETRDTSFAMASEDILAKLQNLPQTNNQYISQNISKKPAQSSNDLELLLAEAQYVKPVVDYSMPLLLKAFEKQTSYVFSDTLTPNTIVFKKTNNKGSDRIKQKVRENDVGEFQNILDYVRCSISFPTVESLFNFVKFAYKFNFKADDFKDFEYATQLFGYPKAIYGVNNFAIDNLDDTKYQAYPFLKEKVKLKYTEFMDYKLYIKVPVHDNNYMVAEVLCTLHDFTKYYELTHFLYEYARDISKIASRFNLAPDVLTKYFKALIAYIHYEKVIRPYNNNALDSYHLDTKQGKTGDYKKDLDLISSDGQDILHSSMICDSASDEKKDISFTRDIANILLEYKINKRG